MTSPSHSSDEDFLESFGISLDEVNVTADADTHASDPHIKLDVGESSVAEIPIKIFDHNNPVGAIISLSYLGYLRHFDIVLPYTRSELIHADLGLGLVPLAWRWYRTNLQTVRRRKSLKDLRAFFDTCTLEKVEVGAMTARLQSWIQADPDFQRSDALSRRRVVLSHPVLRQYYLGERVDLQIRGCRSVPYSPPEDIISLMQPIGSRLDSFQRSAPSQPLGTHSSRASGPSTRTPRRRPMTDPSSSTPVEGPSRARPSRSAGPSRAPRAISEATRLLHPGLANLRLPYSIPYYPPDGPLAFREGSLENVDRLDLPPEDITEDPGFGDLRLCPMVRQMEDMGCIGRIVLAETIRSLDRAALGFNDWTVSPTILQADADDEVGTDEEIVLAPRTGEVGESLAAGDDSEDVAPRRRRDT
ncbi:hypothetical protein JCGZ_23003 [Jatropha curcas]|uniref:Aminotransferase-like plant mobile domain-containing protein n=1 Tax=Jatropha curcas TaxID=180498 RepID=A0A067K2B1_JATCU|nr:hypothetical protein JCGZ_23003 [Jatropha curcas]